MLNTLVKRSLRQLQLFIINGNQALPKLISDVWREVVRQLCVVHRIRNALARVPKKKQDEARKTLHRVFYAACLGDAGDEVKQCLSGYSRGFPTAYESLAKHFEECLTFYRFHEPHWKHIRTSNVIE